jgi:lysozyme
MRRENLYQAILDHEGTGPTKEVNGETRYLPYDDSDDVLDDVVGREGDLVGDCTIGPGLNLTVNGIDKQTAFRMMKKHIEKRENVLRNEFTFWPHLSRARQNVLLEMVYNLGYGDFIDFVNFFDALREGDFERAADEILDSDAARDLPDRYQNLARRMREGVPYGAGQTTG